MKIHPVSMPVADFCSAFGRSEIQIDSTYQRSSQVWPSPARSYLIETILKGFPLPKLALHQVTDIKSRKSVKYVIDGQQRSKTIRDFYEGHLRLSTTIELEEAQGRTLPELDEELQETFLSFLLEFNQFEAATDEDVREYFRRINLYTVPLNSEEQRHAQFQGDMKWFIHELASRHSEFLVRLGVLTQKSAVRMGDAKFFAEIVHALQNGIVTTNKNKLNGMYKKFEKDGTLQKESSPGPDRIRLAIDNSLRSIQDLPGLEGSSITKTHVFYSLVLAMIVVQSRIGPVDLIDAGATKLHASAADNLLRLGSALDDPESYTQFANFVAASNERTNVKAQRESRVRWLAKALTEPSV